MARQLQTRDPHVRHKGLGIPLLVLGSGFLVRLWNAVYRFLNPDEAIHYLLSVQPSGAAAERASLVTSHPPLLILLLHYWTLLGRSELFLRIPMLIAGTAFCWMMFLWLRRVTDSATAQIALLLLMFSPILILQSAEVRQYPLLLFFCVAALYLFDRALDEMSLGLAALSAISMCLALLTHYSALIFALTIGLYALVRFTSARPRRDLIVVWAMGQIAVLGLFTFLYFHHVRKLQARGQPAFVAETYARKSVFHPGQEHALAFIARSTFRLFHYFFNQGLIGAIALVLFVWGLVILIQAAKRRSAALPWHLALLFAFPLLANAATALWKVYPFGGTRHDLYLAIFIFPPIAVALAHWVPGMPWLRPALIAAFLIAANLFGAPIAEFIRARDQNRTLMAQAVSTLRSLPAGSVIFTDDQGGLLLSYYLCGHEVVQLETVPFQPFLQSRCGQQRVVSLDPDLWVFRPDTFSRTVQRAAENYNLAPGTVLWTFQAGWFDRGYTIRDEQANYPCSDLKAFGNNIYLCRVVIPPRSWK